VATNARLRRCFAFAWRNRSEGVTPDAYVGVMEEAPRYRICAERNVAAAFEHFHSRPAWLRPASNAYCGALDTFARVTRSATLACSTIGSRLQGMRAVAARESR
jgi:hypothetical protein